MSSKNTLRKGTQYDLTGKKFLRFIASRGDFVSDNDFGCNPGTSGQFVAILAVEQEAQYPWAIRTWAVTEAKSTLRYWTN